MNRFVNLTPHTVNVVVEGPEGPKTWEIESAGDARCAVRAEPAGSVGDIPLFRTAFGDVSGLPEAQEGTMFIVSLLVRQALPGRTDLCSPSQPIRDTDGKVIGCKGFDVN